MIVLGYFEFIFFEKRRVLHSESVHHRRDPIFSVQGFESLPSYVHELVPFRMANETPGSKHTATTIGKRRTDR